VGIAAVQIAASLGLRIIGSHASAPQRAVVLFVPIGSLLK
jgi:hypothetical protein